MTYAFWAAAPKGQCPVEHRGEFPDVRPSFHPSVHLSFLPSPPPVSQQDLKFALPALKFALRTLNLALQASNQPPVPQNCTSDLKSALQTFNQPSKHETSPPNLNYTLKPSNMPSVAYISHLEPPQDRRKDGRLEIHPCVLQDIGPLGPLPKKW